MLSRHLFLVVLCGGLLSGFDLTAQSPPYGSISPAGGSYPVGTQLEVNIEFCSPESFFDSWGLVRLNGGTIGATTPGGSAPGCSDFQSGTFTITINDGANTVTGDVSDNVGPAHVEATYNSSPPPPPLAPIVTPDGVARLMAPITGAKLAFVVKNPNAAPRTYTISASCAPAVSSCSAATPVIVNGMQSVDVWATFSVSGATFAPGTLTVTATDQGAPSATDNGSVAVTIAPTGVAVERALCLTVAAGAGAAYECGDLRLAHLLPAVRTLNTARAPVLLYNSQHARPYPLVFADLTAPSPLPQTIRAILKVNDTEITQRDIAGSVWDSAGQVRRVVVGFAADTFPTGVHTYQLEIQRLDPTVVTLQTVSGQLPIVNRRASAFGPGWWLAGWERLIFTGLPAEQRMWVGGDGSVRIYQRSGVIGADTAYLAALVDSPDTLLHTAANEWKRLLPGGGSITFTSNGIHRLTTNRLGYATEFVVDSNDWRLLKIRVPPDTSMSYTFSYSGTPALLQYVNAPDSVVGTFRVTTLAYVGDTLKITDPGSRPVGYRYEAGTTKRIVSRKSRRGAVTAYAYDAGSRLASSRLGIPGADSINLAFCAAEARGLVACSPTPVVPDSAYTRFDGPRAEPPADSGDVHAFWVDRFGSPWKLRDPYGHLTIITRAEPSFPALATRVQDPNGRILAATYDGRGKISSTTDSSVLGPGQHATSRYQWDQRWDEVTEIVVPTGEVTRFAYDATNGNRLWQEDGRGSSSRVTLAYYLSGPCAGLLKTITVPGGAKDSLAYDARCNLEYARTPRGYVATSVSDRIGRPRVVRTPIGALTREDSTFYDERGLVWRTVAYGPAVPGVADMQRVMVRNFFNPEGQLDSLKRWTEPDVADIDTITTRWHYDLAGRVIAEVSSDQRRDSTHYDPAGNPDTVVTRRGDVITMVYDRLNRLRRRTIPPVLYYGRYHGIATYESNMGERRPYPYFPTSAPSGCSTNVACYTDSTQWTLTLPGDTELYSYGPMGELLTADNADAKVKRTYFKNGHVETDTLRVRNWNGTDSGHVYGLRYSYDLSGRLLTLRHPWLLAPRNPGVMDLASYAYDPVTGLLSTVTDPLGNQFTFTHNLRNERIRLDRPGGITERFTHDEDGLLIADTTQQGGGWFRRATFEYADAQRVSVARNSVAWRDTVRSYYNGLGHLAKLIYELPAYRGDSVIDTAHVFSVNRFTMDALGNVVFAKDSNNLTAPFSTSTTTPQFDHAYGPGTGRLVATQGDRLDSLVYDAAGNLVYSEATGVMRAGATGHEDQANFYGADNRLRAAERRTYQNVGQSETNPWTMTFERYRYDALGRRVLVRTWRRCQAADFPELHPCSWSSIRRVVWDGATELYEIQGYGGVVGYDPDPTLTWDPSVGDLENDTLPVYKTYMYNGSLEYDASPHYGRVSYTSGPEIDQPLSAIRIHFTRAVYDNHQQGWHAKTWGPLAVAPHWNWRGHPEIGAFANGTLSDCHSSQYGDWCAQVPWRVRPFAFTQQPADTIPWWWGGWLRDKEDGTGTLFRRNRYVDPLTGRFTQEDPIGLAGGLNLYGFAAGDPVNFSDPFGLSPIKLLGKIVDLVRLGRRSKTVMRNVPEDALVRAVREGEDVRLPTRQAARRVAREAGDGKSPVGPERSPGGDPHYHPHGREGGHVFYGIASALTLEHYAQGSGGLVEGGAKVIDFFNPLSLPKDLMDLAGSIKSLVTGPK